jgi:hypothetical protein
MNHRVGCPEPVQERATTNRRDGGIPPDQEQDVVCVSGTGERNAITTRARG